MAFRPIASVTRLPKDEVIRPEDKSEGPDLIESTVLGSKSVRTATGLVLLDIDALELELRVTAVLSGVVYGVLVTDNFPELGSNLVPHCPPWM